MLGGDSNILQGHQPALGAGNLLTADRGPGPGRAHWHCIPSRVGPGPGRRDSSIEVRVRPAAYFIVRGTVKFESGRQRVLLRDSGSQIGRPVLPSPSRAVVLLTQFNLTHPIT